MTLTAYYNAGIATLTGGSAAVVGVGTAWTTNNLAPGDQIESAAGERATILSINSPTSITLDNNFAGTEQTAAPYKIWRTFDAQYLMEGARAAMNLLGSGSVAALAALTGDADKGMYFTGPNVLALFSLTAAARALLDDASASDMRDTLGVTAALDGLSASIATAAANVGKRGTVRVATTANITIATGLNVADVIDGVALVAGDLVLVKNQTAAEQNGIYVVGPAPARSGEYDTYDEHPGSLIVVQEGTTLADTFWYCTSNVGGTLGTTAIAYSQMTISLVDDSVTNAKLANMATATIKGRTTAGTGDPEDLSISQLRGLLLASTAIRDVLTVNRTYYVRADGSDANNGLANTSGGAFLTLQKAIDVSSALDLSIFSVTVQVGAGTYTGAVTARSYIGAGPIKILGDVATPSNVLISTIVSCFVASNVIGTYDLRGMKLQTTSGSGIYVEKGSRVTFQSIDFGACAQAHVLATAKSSVIATGAYSISGGSGRHWWADTQSLITVAAITITLIGTPAFSGAFALAYTGSVIQCNANTFSGGATGVRYDITAISVVFTNSGGAAYLPGNAAGTAVSGGQYI